MNIWTEFILTATYLINRLPTAVLSGKSPFDLVYNNEPNLLNLKCFGCLCFSAVLNESDKFASRSDKCVFVGYAFDKKGYKLYNIDQKKFMFSRDVKFYETVFPFKNTSFTKDFVFDDNGVNDLNLFDQDFDSSQNNFRTNEPYDDKIDSIDGNNKSLPESSTHKPSVSTVEEDASVDEHLHTETVKSADTADVDINLLVDTTEDIDTVNVDNTRDTSSRKDTEGSEYATETIVSDDI